MLQEEVRIKAAKNAYRVGRTITAPKVLLIDDQGTNRGIVSIRDALDVADQAGLDLVEILPTGNPPTCKVLDFGRMTFGKQKQNKQKQKRRQLKEIKYTPNIDVGDYGVKLRNMKKFIEQGDKVKITVRFRGREMMHQDLGLNLIKRVKEDMAELVIVDQETKLEGRQMIMILSPKQKK